MPDRILGLVTPDTAPGTKPSLFFSTVQADLPKIWGAAWHKGTTAPAGAQEDDFWYDTVSGQLRRYKSGLWIADLALANRVKLVSPNKGGHYTSLVAAHAAITDAAAGNEYTILVEGDIAETTLVVAKSYVHVVGLGHATVTVTHTGTVPAARFLDLTHCTWRDLDVIRAGTGSSNHYAIEFQGTCDRTVRLERVRGLNQSTSSRSIGLLLVDTVSPTLLGCDFQGGGDGSTTTLNHGVYCAGGTPDPYAEQCRFLGGTNGHGGMLDFNIRGEWVRSRFEGGAIGYGLYAPTAAAPVLRWCYLKAGDGAASSYGLRADGGSFIRANHCTARGSTFGANGIGWYFLGSASAELEECATHLPGGEAAASYTSANNGRFQAVTAYPFQVASLAVNVTAATASGVLALGTTVGGSELASGISLATTGLKTVALPAAADAILAAGAYIYATVTGASAADGSFSTYVGYVAAGAQQHALYTTSTGRVNVRGGTYLSNAASEAVVFDGDNNADQFVITGATIAARRGYPAGSQKAAIKSLSQTSILHDAQVYGCTLRGGVLLTTLAVGRRLGSNVAVGLYLPNRGGDDFLTLPPNWDYGWLTALYNSLATPAGVLALTDSVGQGFSVPSVTDWAVNGWTGQLFETLWAQYGKAGEFEPTANSTSFNASYIGRQYWTAFAASASWQLWGLGRAPTWTTTGVDLVTFTYPYDVTASRFFYVDNTAGTWKYSINGAADVTVTNGDTKAVKFVDFGARTAGDVIVFKQQSITQCFAANGMHLRKASAGVEGYRGTYTGATAGEWIRQQYFPTVKSVLWQGNTATASPFNAGNLGPPTQPHAAVIGMGLNDANTKLSTSPTGGLYRFKRGLQALCAALRRGRRDCSIAIVAMPSPDTLSSDMTLSTNFYGSDGAYPYYVEAMGMVAAAFNAAFINCHAAAGETPVADALYAGTSIHPNQSGHDFIYRMVARAAIPR